MSEFSPEWTSHEVLWELGARFIDANAETSDEVVSHAIGVVAELLHAEAVSVWRVDQTTMVSEVRHSWVRSSSSSLDSTRVVADPSVKDAVLAGGGIAILPLTQVLGEEVCRRRGWLDGRSMLALIHQSEHTTEVLSVSAGGAGWGERERALCQGVVTMMRQFQRRVRTELRLASRHRLDGFTLSLAAQLQSATADTVDSIAAAAIEELRELVDAVGVVLVDILDDRTVGLPHVIAQDVMPPEWRTIEIADVRALPGATSDDLRAYASSMRTVELAAVVEATLGPEIAMSLPLDGVELTLFPASVDDGGAVLAMSRRERQSWRSEEVDAFSTIASLLAQARGRAAAQRSSQVRLASQQVVAEIGERFVEATLDDAHDVVRAAIASAASHVAAQAAFLAELDEATMTATIPHAWTADDAVVPDRTSDTTAGGESRSLFDEMIADATTARTHDPHPALADFLGLADGERWSSVVAPVRRPEGTKAALCFLWPGDGVEDLDEWAGLADSLADIVGQFEARIAAERTIAHRLRRDRELASIADAFLGATVASAEETIEASLASLGVALPDLVGVALRSIGTTASVVEAVWTDYSGRAPRKGSAIPTTHSGRLSGAAFKQLSERPDWADRVRDAWRSDVETEAVPVVVSDQVDAVLTFATSTVPSDLDLETFRQYAAMLGQLRGRLDGERARQRNLAAQRVLSQCAAALAEGGPEEFDAALSRAMGWVADFCGADAVVDWRVDERNKRYVRHLFWTAEPTEDTELWAESPWGASPMLDRARRSGLTECVSPTTPDRKNANRIALPRGAGSVERVLLVATLDPAPWPDDVIEMLESLSRMLNEVESRVEAQRYAQAAFQDAPIGVVLRDANLKLVTCNQAFVDFLGAESMEELIGTSPQHVYDDDFDDIGWDEGGEGTINAVAAFRGPGGARVWGQMRASVIDEDSAEPLWLIHIEDVTERRRVEQLLRFQATHDELTGLANRRRLLDEIHRIVSGDDSVAVLLLDIDRFKNINDSLGHDRGDELLVVIADRLRLAVRPGDLVARLGGDEFAIVLPGPVTVAEAEMVAERLMRLIGEPVTVGRQNLYPTASIGIAVADDQTEVDDLLRRADTAMYRAKAQGRARAESFGEELREAVTTRMATESGLRHAIRNNEFIVHYQPEVSLHDGVMLGAEALVRWIHPEKGLLAAGAFIEVAEETGVVTEIGEFVLAEACREAAAWPGGDLGPMIRVNLAAAQLQRDETVTLVRSVLAETGLAPGRLCLEITESAVMSDVARSEEILRRLKNLGVELAVDDFGTGFSSLAYLKRFPVDALKIDRTFVKDLGHDAEDEAFVRSIVSLAEALGLSVVAEGVETALQSEMLLDLGCSRAQGYLFAKPGPPEDLRTRLRDRIARLEN